LTEFADFVEKQQKRHAPTVNGAPVAGGKGKSKVVEDQSELDFLESLGLSDGATSIRLRDLLLKEPTDADAGESLEKLVDVLRVRIDEGHGECLFDLGLENNGESMGLTKEQWELSVERLKEAATKINADCRLLLTRNVGGDVEATSIDAKEKGCVGKVLMRRKPDTVEDVIETRIAVVGNGISILILG
jgi:hypothetical protein